MIKEGLMFATAFALCAAIGSSMTACGDDCDCPERPDRPATIGATRATITVSPSDAAPEIQPRGASLESTGTKLVVRYVESGVHYEAVYVVDGPLY